MSAGKLKANTAADKKKLLKSLLRKRITIDAFANHADDSFTIIMNLGPGAITGFTGEQRMKLKKSECIAISKRPDCINITLNLSK